MSLYTKVKKFGHDHFLQIDELLHHEHTPYQEVLIAKIKNYGLTLILDNELQTCDIDYEAYHNGLIGLPYTPQPKERCLIIGTGEGVSIDLLQRKGWKNIDAVELDEKALQLYSKHLSKWNNCVYERTDEYNLIIGDGLEHLKSTPKDYYSWVILDIPSQPLLERVTEWIGECHRVLVPSGVLTTQDGDNQMGSYSYDTAKLIFKQEPRRMGVLDWSFLHTVKL